MMRFAAFIASYRPMRSKVMNKGMVNFNSAGDLSSLVGMRLGSVQLGKFIAHFNFEECQLSTESCFEHHYRENISRFEIYGPKKEFSAYSLFEERVDQVIVISPDVLEFLFSNGERLRFIANGRGGSFSLSTVNEIVIVD